MSKVLKSKPGDTVTTFGNLEIGDRFIFHEPAMWKNGPWVVGKLAEGIQPGKALCGSSEVNARYDESVVRI